MQRKPILKKEKEKIEILRKGISIDQQKALFDGYYHGYG